MGEKHEHSWQHLTGSRFVCRFAHCQLVSDISMIISNLKHDVKKQTRIDVISKLLFDGDLRKDAHDREYAWVRQNTPEGTAIVPQDKQESLL